MIKFIFEILLEPETPSTFILPLNVCPFMFWGPPECTEIHTQTQIVHTDAALSRKRGCLLSLLSSLFPLTPTYLPSNWSFAETHESDSPEFGHLTEIGKKPVKSVRQVLLYKFDDSKNAVGSYQLAWCKATAPTG